jgi:class 3 adenylate cyclase/tetratricopeptide (TPR) repeat protein
MLDLTFAFTEVDGGTTRLESNPVGMHDRVRRHDAILRSAITEHGGQVFKMMSNTLCSVFASPRDAVAAMLAAQRALCAEDLSASDGLRVRAAIHTGTAEMRGGDYFGPAVNKVARVLAIGHGGQILLTAETAAPLDGTLPAQVALRELGAYHLKDIDKPQRLYQLLAPGLAAEFPPLRSLGTLPSDLSIVDAAEFHAVASFSGRDDELAGVHAALQDDGAIVVVHGLGGIGKSSIAREYGWRHREHYSVMWWLNAQSEDGIIDGLLRLGSMFVQGLDQLADRRAAAQRVIDSVLGGFEKPVLLVFDNLEDERLMRSWLPRTGSRALATSRDTTWGDEITAIALEIWSLQTSARYLQRASGRNDLSEPDARAIVEALGALPLALSHAAAALRSLRMVSPQRYLEHITEHLKKAPRGAEYPRSVFATFTTAITQAEQHAGGTAALLCFAALFAPAAIPDELFRQANEYYPEGLQPTLAGGVALDLHAAAGEARLREGLVALERLSLLSFAPGSRTYGMHRLVQLAALDLTGEDSRAWRECAVSAADAAFPASVDFPTWPQCERLVSHARTALDALGDDTEFLAAGDLGYRCADYLMQRGEYAMAEQISKRALAIREKARGLQHADVARSLNNLGLIYWSQARYTEAEALHARALTIWEKVVRPDDPDFALGLSNLAKVYFDQGRHADARRLHARSLAIWEKAYGPHHPDVARSLNNLAVVHFSQSRYAEAEKLYARALAIRERTLHPDHPEVALSLNNLAAAYVNQGRYEAAEPLYLRALAIREKVLPPDHPHIALSLNNLGELYFEQGRYGEAEQIHARALAIRERVLRPDHPDIALSLNNLANVCRARERYAQPLR